MPTGSDILAGPGRRSAIRARLAAGLAVLVGFVALRQRGQVQDRVRHQDELHWYSVRGTQLGVPAVGVPVVP